MSIHEFTFTKLTIRSKWARTHVVITPLRGGIVPNKTKLQIQYKYKIQIQYRDSLSRSIPVSFVAIQNVERSAVRDPCSRSGPESRIVRVACVKH